MAAISDKTAQGAKPKEKPYRIKDVYGLYLEVRPTGKKSWRIRYSFQGKPGIVTIGEYPLMSVREAHLKRDEIRKKIMEGISPSMTAEENEPGVASFKQVANEWVDEQTKNGEHDKKYIDVIKGRLENYRACEKNSVNMDLL
ncbi:Arm DNA-binding domain-containing protein [Cloacibacillus evryensis]|uniref:Arm DNA-binding domain-containing protein n=1 Tax=Cloacibacillus evryensis TaxID=508460 RepID=UPI003AB269F8